MLLVINALLRVQAQRRHFFDKIFIKRAMILLGGNVSFLSHDTCRLIRDHDPPHTIHYL
jgi:hypothetical protein